MSDDLNAARYGGNNRDEGRDGDEHALMSVPPHDAVGAYLLDALSEAEHADFERHLDACRACQAEVANLRVAMHALPASVEQLAPPPELRSRIMAVVEAEAQLLEAAAGPRADLPEPTKSRERRRFRLPALRPAFALACAAALLVLGGLGGVLLGDGGPSDDGARTVVASVERGDASAKLVVDGTASHLEVANLGKPPEGRVYQVWTQRPGGKPQPSTALFVPRADGSASVAVPGSLAGVDQVLVTEEPVGGSDKPSRTPFLSARPRSS